MYYSAIGILAVLILFIVNHDILFGRRASFDKPVWKMYRRFLFVVLLYYITDILWGFFESRKLSCRCLPTQPCTISRWRAAFCTGRGSP